MSTNPECKLPGGLLNPLHLHINELADAKHHIHLLLQQALHLHEPLNIQHI